MENIKISYDDVKFRHVGFDGKCGSHNGIITIASYASRETGLVWYACSFCSHKDVFSKEVGRRKAVARLENEPNPALFSKLKCNDVTIGIINNMLSIRNFPSWAENQLLLELAQQLVIKFSKESEK